MKAAAALLIGLAAGSAQAQPAGFDATMADALADSGDAAPALRCAGLFRAFRLLAGDDTEVGADARAAELDLAVAAGLVREAETGATPGAAMDVIAPMIAAAAELYLERMVANEAETQSVMDDALAEALDTCAVLRSEVQGATNEPER